MNTIEKDIKNFLDNSCETIEESPNKSLEIEKKKLLEEVKKDSSALKKLIQYLEKTKNLY